MQDEETASPLAEADARSLNDLFDADPLSLSDRDIDLIVQNIRENREKWAREESEAKRQGRARRPSAYKTPPAQGKLSLDMIGLGKKKPEDG